MRRCIAAALLLLLVACGDDSGPADPLEAERQFVEQWDDVPEGPDFEGHPVAVDEEDRTIFMGDCNAAERATASGGPYGPNGSEKGYAYICP